MRKMHQENTSIPLLRLIHRHFNPLVISLYFFMALCSSIVMSNGYKNTEKMLESSQILLKTLSDNTSTFLFFCLKKKTLQIMTLILDEWHNLLYSLVWVTTITIHQLSILTYRKLLQLICQCSETKTVWVVLASLKQLKDVQLRSAPIGDERCWTRRHQGAMNERSQDVMW